MIVTEFYDYEVNFPGKMVRKEPIVETKRSPCNVRNVLECWKIGANFLLSFLLSGGGLIATFSICD